MKLYLRKYLKIWEFFLREILMEIWKYVIILIQTNGKIFMHMIGSGSDGKDRIQTLEALYINGENPLNLDPQPWVKGSQMLKDVSEKLKIG